MSNYLRVGGYPHFFILDANGDLLDSQDTVELEEGVSYSLLAVLQR